MALSAQEREQAVEWIRDLFATDLTKVLLSVLIILSVLPFRWAQDYSVVFFGIFAVELALRGLVFFHDLRHRAMSKVELVFLIFDVLATLSFLPMEALWGEIRFLRLFRLSRMLLLLNYWGPIVREVWMILAKRERRYQLSFFAAAVLILSFTSAVLLAHFETKGVDINGDGDPTNDDRSFVALLWWAFRQIESADNLVRDPNASLAFVFSIFLTLSGLFLFSFLVGIGTSVVEELVAVSKERRIGMRKHSVICNISPHSEVLLQELVAYYSKSFRAARIITLGPAENRYDYMHEGALQKIRYRQGQAMSRHDLVKVDVDRATRVILLGRRDDPHSDSEIVSQILSVREVNPRCPIYAEIFAAANVEAALHAGGQQLVPVMANRLVGHYLANIIVFPGVERVYDDLLTSEGDEIYTCVYDEGAMAGRKPPSGALLPFGELLERAHRALGVILLGHLLVDDTSPTGFCAALVPGCAAPHGTAHGPVAEVSQLRGFFGVAASFEELRGFVESLPDVTTHTEEHSAETVPRFGACPEASSIQRFVICGFHDGLIDFCEALILFSRVPALVIMVTDADAAVRVAQAFVEQLRGEQDSLEQHVAFRPRPDVVGQLQYDLPGGGVGQLTVAAADWSDERVLCEHLASGHRLAATDGLLLTYTPGEDDPDARTSLALLKLMHLAEERSPLLRPELRVFCEVQSTEKAALFARRFSRTAAGGCPVVSVVAADKVRNSFLAQAVFVPGSVGIYRELLNDRGLSLCKLLPAQTPDASAPLTFGQLLSVLYERDGMLLVAVELQDLPAGEMTDAPRHRQVVVNPRVHSPRYRFTAGQLVSIFAIADFSVMEKAQRCSLCFRGSSAADAPRPVT
jgi:hypothetical protein